MFRDNHRLGSFSTRTPLVVIGYFDIRGAAVNPIKDDTVLVVDRDAPLVRPITLESMQTIAVGNSQISWSGRRIDAVKQSGSLPVKRRR
jgi:hypothetical protein